MAAGSDAVLTASGVVAASACATPKVASIPAANTTAAASLKRRQPARRNRAHPLRTEDSIMTPPQASLPDTASYRRMTVNKAHSSCPGPGEAFRTEIRNYPATADGDMDITPPPTTAAAYIGRATHLFWARGLPRLGAAVPVTPPPAAVPATCQNGPETGDIERYPDDEHTGSHQEKSRLTPA